MMGARWCAWLSGLWAGGVLAIGGMAAPGLFAVLDRPMAGLAAGQLFTLEAYVSLVFGVLLLLLIRGHSRVLNRRLPGLVLALLLVALACTIVSHFVLRPLMPAAKAGVGVWSFATLHMLSGGLYAVKTIAVTGLSLRMALTSPAASD